jgi:class 3 adenylate cyclase
MTRSAVASAMLELGALPTLTRLEEVLRRRLNDPDLRVLRWSPSSQMWIDEEGSQVQPPGPRDDRAFLFIDRGGELVAAVDHDASLLNDADLADTVTAAARVALDATDVRDELRAHGGNTAGLPRGDVTFVFADLEGSTRLLDLLGPRYHEVLADVRRISADMADKHGGRMVDAIGDEVLMAFPTASEAVGAAVGISRRMSVTAWPDEMAVRFRMGIHRGRPEVTRSGYVGLDVHRAARIMAIAHGGQIVASMAVLEGLQDVERVRLRPLGKYALRGLEEPLALVAIEADGLPSEFPALMADRVDDP